MFLTLCWLASFYSSNVGNIRFEETMTQCGTFEVPNDDTTCDYDAWFQSCAEEC